MTRMDRYFSPEVLAVLLEREAAIERARSRGLDVLHAPYCACVHTWTESCRDPRCVVIA